MTQFTCISFGPANNNSQQWYNERSTWSTQRRAERYGLASMPIAGTFGYVVIEETEDAWKVVDECGAPEHAVSIHQDAHGDFHVQPAPQLMMV
jgi:hypothetical protein